MTSMKASAVVTAAAAILLTGCAQNITGTAVTAAGGAPPEVTISGGDEGQCATVAAPLEDIPAVSDREPQLRIPTPEGWERETMMDSELIRFTLVATNLITEGFATNAVVTLESASGTQDPTDVFDQNRGNLESMLGAFDLETVDNTTCGLPSETTHYMAPPMGPAPERPVIMHAVVADTGATTYLATLTIQTTDGQNPDYIRDSQEIIDGFQMLLPSS